MPGLQDLMSGAAATMPQPAPQQPVSGGNPLAALAQGQVAPQGPPPAPTQAQTVAALHRFGEVKQAMRPVLGDPKLGKDNIRPKLLDAASKLLGSKVLSLSEIMNAIKGLPDDPLAQKKFVEKIYGDADKAQKIVLSHHAAAPAMQGTGEPDQWNADNHQTHIDGLMGHYNGRS